VKKRAPFHLMPGDALFGAIESIQKLRQECVNDELWRERAVAIGGQDVFLDASGVRGCGIPICRRWIELAGIEWDGIGRQGGGGR
jgi:hypothetical protein